MFARGKKGKGKKRRGKRENGGRDSHLQGLVNHYVNLSTGTAPGFSEEITA